MALGPIILAAAFSLAILKTGGIEPVWDGTQQHFSTMAQGCFPPSSARVLAVDVLGAGSSAAAPVGTVNVALAIFLRPAPCLAVCLVLAIYNTNFHLLDNHLSTHYPTQLPNSIHTASSLLALSTSFSLGCSISWITNFQFLQISLDTLTHGDGYLNLTPIVCIASTQGGYSLALILILTMLE